MKLAINTGGGDAPGLNAVIRAVVSAAQQRGWECWGIREGYNGILEPQNFVDGGVVRLTRESVSGITHLGGTILGTTNKGNPLEYPVAAADGSLQTVDRCDEIIDYLKNQGFDALIAIGGDGSLSVAHEIGERGGINVIGVPKTIDNDLKHTIATFGFDTAVTFATECIDRLHSTAESHRRIMVVEVMGRYAGWIALESGVAGGADAVLIPEIPYDISRVAEKMRSRVDRGAAFSIVVVAEGARPRDGQRAVKGTEIGRAERLGGIGDQVAAQLQELTGQEARCVVLGHLLRGGTPSARDRLLSLRFGAAAVRALEEGQRHVMVSLHPPYVKYVPLTDVAHAMKLVPTDSDTVATARDMGISLGD
ncbi:6-phosphofructokinase [Spirochaeta africana]|uniref:ATP-dependent 6-phosphofructokinase n=1 Tax=Spirochaeta africana (strain ATCC 700263 / DSM 8902 / Z-7692) TaxID=889378 RepID=H9UGE2_SPIAZ|nr:ATP-dependent 6-phosphofructokinase [Spirochaeta africana]AFG36585.1 6-phosphofructokinase [Spirochaeta africana DSM 8902]